MIYLAAFLFLIVIGLFLCANMFAKIAMYPKTWPYEETYNNEINSGRFTAEYLTNLTQEEFYIDSPFGYKLHAIYFPNKASRKTIIFCHGITYSLYGSIKYIDIFYKRGFNVLVYDHRFHGKSEGPNSTYGYYEKQDLKACTDWVFNRTGFDTIVGIHGESLGAATALQNSAIDSRVSFYIADCPYSDIWEELKIRLKKDYHLPHFPLLHLASIIYRLRTGASFKAASPIKAIEKVETPIFFIHGASDNYIPNNMSKEMYSIKKGPKKLYIAPNADHAESICKNMEEYEIKVEEFLKEIDVV